MKKIWDDIKTYFKNLWTNIILVFLFKVYNICKKWVIKNWFYIVNYTVIVLVYSNISGKEDVIWSNFLLSFWIFLSLAFVGYKMLLKKNTKK